MKSELIKIRLWNRDDALAYVIILAVFAGMSCSNLTVALSAGISLFEYILYALADHYYLIYGWLIFLVFVSGKEVRAHNNSEILRYGSFSRYHSVTLAAAAIRIALFVASHILIAAIIGSFHFSPVNAFTVNGASGYYDSNLELLVSYQRYFESPVTALLCAAGYLWLGSLFLYAVIFLASQYRGSRGMLTACFLIIVSAVSGRILPFDESPLEFLFANNYFILHHPLLSVSPAAVAANLAIMACLILAGAADLPRRLRRYRLHSTDNSAHNDTRTVTHRPHRQSLRPARSEETPNVSLSVKIQRSTNSLLFSPAPRRGFIPLYLLLLIGLGIFPQISTIGSSAGGNVVDLAWALLKGYSAEGFNLIEFLYYLAWFAFPMIQIGVFWQAEKERKNNAALLRTGSFRQWRTLTDRGCLRFILRYWLWYVALLAVALTVLYFLCGYGAGSAAEYYDFFGVSETGFLTALLVSALLRLPELLLLYELSLILYVLSGNTLLSFFLPLTGYGVGILIPILWNPFGLSTAYSLLGLISDGRGSCVAAGICTVGLLIVLRAVNLAMRKNP